MICNRCKTDNPEIAQFCCNCAFPLGAASQQNPERDHSAFIGNKPTSRNQNGASGRAITSMILSIASLLLCCTFLGVPGMILGKMEMNAISDGRAPQAGDGFAKTGFYLGIAGTALSLLGTVLYVAGVMYGAMAHF